MSELKLQPAEHLLVLPVPFRQRDGALLMESQAHHGLLRWLDSFQTLILAAPLMPESEVPPHLPWAWQRVDDLRGRVQFVPLPWGYTPRSFIEHLPEAVRLLRTSVKNAAYLQFGVGGLVGDWASVACELAIAAGRPYSIHFDTVAHECEVKSSVNRPAHRRAIVRVKSALMELWHRRLCKRADLLLCHGMDCYRTYGPWARSPDVVHNIHDIHAGANEVAGVIAVREKIAAMLNRAKLRIVYPGRMEVPKAPIEWVRALHRAREQGARFHATWIGDGSLRPPMEAEVARLGLGDVIDLPGFISDRAKVFQMIADADLMMFTHITPESPRALVESLMKGTPIVGYASHYPQDLIAQHGGGRLCEVHDWTALGDLIAQLDADRESLGDMITRAARAGEAFTSDAVFRHRSELIRDALRPAA